MNTQPTTTISSRIPTHIIENIDNIAKKTQRSRSFHIKQALEIYSQQMQDFEDYEILQNIESRLKISKKNYLDGEEVIQELGIDFKNV